MPTFCNTFVSRAAPSIQWDWKPCSASIRTVSGTIAARANCISCGVISRVLDGIKSQKGDNAKSWRRLYDNPLDLVERDFVAPAVIEPRRLRAGVVGDLLGVLDDASVFQVGGDGGDQLQDYGGHQ